MHKLPFMYSLFMWITTIKKSVFLIRFFAIITLFLISLLFYFISQKLFKNKFSGIISSLAFIIAQTSAFAIWGAFTPYLMFFTMISVFLFLYKKIILKFLFIGIFSSLAFIVHQSGIIIFLSFFLISIKDIKKLSLMIIGFSLPLIIITLIFYEELPYIIQSLFLVLKTSSMTLIHKAGSCLKVMWFTSAFYVLSVIGLTKTFKKFMFKSDDINLFYSWLSMSFLYFLISPSFSNVHTIHFIAPLSIFIGRLNKNFFKKIDTIIIIVILTLFSLTGHFIRYQEIVNTENYYREIGEYIESATKPSDKIFINLTWRPTQIFLYSNRESSSRCIETEMRRKAAGISIGDPDYILDFLPSKYILVPVNKSISQ